MNNFYKIVFALCLVIGLPSLYAQQSLFSTKPYAEIVRQASSQTKPILVYFDQIENWNCISLEGKLVSDAALTPFLKENFVVTKPSNSNDWEDVTFLLQINVYPSLVVFRPDGTPFYLLKGDFTTEDLVRNLRSIKGYMALPHYNPQAGIHYQLTDNVLPVSPDVVKEVIAFKSSELKPAGAVVYEETRALPSKPANPVIREETHYTPAAPVIYHESHPVPRVVKEPKPVIGGAAVRMPRFALQFGSFGNETLANSHLLDCQRILPNHSFRIEQAYINGKLHHRVMGGAFYTHEEAEVYETKVKASRFDCLIVKIAD